MTALAVLHELSGLGEIDARRHITTAVMDLFEDLDGRQEPHRVDAIDKPCKEHPGTATALTGARRHLRAARRATSEPAALEALRLLGRALDNIGQALAAGCEHTCPELPTSRADADRFACQLIDRLDSAGIHLAGGAR
jgi:hypothetical protein